MILLFLLLLIATPQQLSNHQRAKFIVWNVGQGSWSTWIKDKECHHIDMGGELSQIKKATQVCGYRKNFIYITHLDWDHINQIRRYFKQSPHSCLMPYPVIEKKSRPQQWLKNIPTCLTQNSSSIQLIHQPYLPKTRNQASWIYKINKRALISGDSPISEERKWAHKITKPIDVLLLGHHGSYTSTSTYLLEQSKPKMAIASSRKKRFGHPHQYVKEKSNSSD
ncbi:MAG: hypothetical protein HRT44_08275 [Bdellovibrionales bacterium]|nr:hypothetical protein [Bdellovibrionales bacterium]